MKRQLDVNKKHRKMNFLGEGKMKVSDKCHECFKVFTTVETVFSYGSCKIDLCRKCFMLKLED